MERLYRGGDCRSPTNNQRILKETIPRGSQKRREVETDQKPGYTT
jgi:hypothetical protein